MLTCKHKKLYEPAELLADKMRNPTQEKASGFHSEALVFILL